MQHTQIEMQFQLVAANEQATALISLAEDLFGSICSPWTYNGVIFRDCSPHLYYAPETTTVQISLSFKAIGDERQRDFQLAHEVCHLLYPSVEPEHPEKPQTNVINEGISTYFSVFVVTKLHGEDAAQAVLESLATHSPRYFFAFQQVAVLMRMDRDSIKRIRETQPMINKVSEIDLQASGLALTEDAIKALVAVF
jgi:hypothetical protein